MTRAATWLAAVLAARPSMPAEAVRIAASARDLEWRSVQRAATRLGVQRRRVGFGPGSRVVWSIDATPGPTDDIGDAAALIARARAAGVIVYLTPEGGLRARGGRALETWQPVLTRHAADVIEHLHAERVLDDGDE